MLTTEAVSLVLTTAKGLIKLTKRIDYVLAEKTAVQSPLALPVPELRSMPQIHRMRMALEKLLKDTREEKPDPLGEDRSKIRAILDIQDSLNSDQKKRLFGFMKIYLPEQALERVFNLNSEFMTSLQDNFPDWVDDNELKVAAFYISAGKDNRNEGYTWRIALTIVDVLSEFGAENMALFTRDKQIQSIVGAILKRFGEADFQNTDSTGQLLRAALSATLNGALDAKASFDIENKWFEALVGALAEARKAVPEEERDNFLMGLLRGNGYPLLVGTVLETVAPLLNDDNQNKFEEMAAGFLKDVAEIVKQNASFDEFFNDHWGDILRAGLKSVEQHGPGLLENKPSLLGKVLAAVAGKLASQSDTQMLSSEVIYSITDAAVAAVAANSDLVGDTVDEEWLAALINSITSSVAESGIRSTFTKSGMETLIKDTLATFAKHPELIMDNPPTLAGKLLQGVLKSLSEVNTFAAEDLASAAVSGALKSLSDHPELIRFKYAELVASFSGKVGELVKARSLTKVQGVEILGAVTESLAENPALFLDMENRIAEWVVDAVVKAAQGSATRLMAGKTLTNAIKEILSALAKSGRAALENHSADTLAGQLEQLINSALSRADKELGKRIGISTLPDLLGALVMAWSKGEVANIDPEDENFKKLFGELIEQIAA